jgi:hypothetical protein
MTNKSEQPKKQPGGDLVWGARAIGEVIDAPQSKVYTLHAAGALTGADKKVGRRTLVGSRRRLQEIFFEAE